MQLMPRRRRRCPHCPACCTRDGPWVNYGSRLLRTAGTPMRHSVASARSQSKKHLSASTMRSSGISATVVNRDSFSKIRRHSKWQEAAYEPTVGALLTSDTTGGNIQSDCLERVARQLEVGHRRSAGHGCVVDL